MIERFFGHRALPVFHDPSWRLFDRRADYCLWALEEVDPGGMELHPARRAEWRELARAVDRADLGRLAGQSEDWAFAVRSACGAAIDAARHALREQRPALSLGAVPEGWELAVAVAALRGSGVGGRIAVLGASGVLPADTVAVDRPTRAELIVVLGDPRPHASSLAGRATLVLPGRAEWSAIAGGALALRGVERPLPADPLGAHFKRVASGLDPNRLGEDGDSGLPIPSGRLLGFYTPSGIEYALWQLGLLDHVARLGYSDFRVELDRTATGDRMRLWAGEDLLVESVLDREVIAGQTWLYANWITLRHPRGHFDEGRPRLPGQEAPGLGLALETGELLRRMAERVGLAGVALRPAWFHVAFASRHRFAFTDAARQGRFEALCRDLAKLPLDRATREVAEGRVLLNGEPYAWEADPITCPPLPLDPAAVAAERERCHFTTS